MAEAHVLYTLGYEKSTIVEFLDRLRRRGVTIVVDVRSIPLSRKPGFSKKALCQLLKEAGIKYLHVPALGAPKDLREKRRAGAPWADYVVGYTRDVLSQRQFEVEALAHLALKRPISLLCFERNPEECHRSLLAANVAAVSQKQGLRVEHIRY